MAAMAAAPSAGPLAKLEPLEPTPEEKALAEELWACAVAQFGLGSTRGQMGAGLKAFRASLEADPWHADRHYFIGCITSAFHGDRTEAANCFERAIAADPMHGLAYQELCLLYEAFGNFEAARNAARRAVEAGARWQDEWQHPPTWTPNLTASAWWPRTLFPWAEQLEALWETIRDEALGLRGGTSEGSVTMPSSWTAVGSERAEQDADIVAPGGEWREFMLFGASTDSGPNSEAMKHCPMTMGILQRLLPNAVQMAQLGVGEILLSALAPGTRLLPHCASTNVRLTCHLGLVCPKGAQIKVGPTWGEWEEGQCMFFDDSYIHEVRNDSDSVRIVLLIRFWHPELDLKDIMTTLNAGVAEYETLNKLRTNPPMTELAAAKLTSALEGSKGGPPQKAPIKPADLLKLDSDKMGLQ